MRKLALSLLLTLAATGLLAQPAEHDDCDATFIAFIGSNSYQLNPMLKGELGTVRLYTILSYQSAAASHSFGRALWELTITGPDDNNQIVMQKDGIARIDARGAAVADVYWDGHTESGELADPGLYHYTFRARYLRDNARVAHAVTRYEDYVEAEPRDEAFTSTGELVIDYTLDAKKALSIRANVATSCQTQQNAPIETGFGYNFYYGSTHSHSNFSDGGQPLTGCSSGNAYGSGTFTPADVYNYARNTAGMDYWLVNEHNHLIDDSLTTQGSLSEANVKARYQSGRTAATNATVSGSFVALYGMEWGVISNGGHVTLIETPKLFGWESCTGCSGATPECTPGTNCYFDIYTPKLGNYLTMYQRSVENPSTAGPLGIFCHPQTGDFDNYAFNANADAALQGIAVRSGLAFNTATNCATANLGATDYSPRWNEALVKGFHLAPTGDHDAHCDNFGLGLPTRTVYLLPNNVSPALTKSALLSAHKARHFYASEDPNAQLVFATSDGAHVMGDIFSVTGTSVTLRAAIYDPNGEGVSRMELWRGQIGGTAPTAAYKTFTSVSSFSSTETGTSGQQFWYYVKVVQADGNNVWSAPMWVTFGGSSCTDTTAPSVSISAPASGSTVSSCSGATTTIQVTASDASGIASAQVSIDGGAYQTAAFNSISGKYEYTWSPAAGSHTINARATDSSCNSNIGNATQVSVTGSCACADTTAPAVSISAPTNGSTVSSCSGATTKIQVTASDAGGIASAQVSIDGGAWQSAPFNSTSGKYEYTWSPAAGSHTINARATDSSCNSNVGNAAQVGVTGSCTTTTTQLLLNPGFDLGNVNWTASAGVITNDPGEAPHGGSYYAWLDGYGSAHTDSLYQDVTIPANATAATLKFYLHIDTAETTTTVAYDTLKAQVRNTANTVLATLATYSNLNKSTGYTIKQFDLLAYKGQTIRVYFLGVEDASLQTSFVVDTTSLTVTQ